MVEGPLSTNNNNTDESATKATSPFMIQDDTSELLSFNTGFNPEQKRKEVEDRIQEQFQNNKLVVQVDNESDVREIKRLEKETEMHYAAPSTPQSPLGGGDDNRYSSSPHRDHYKQQQQQFSVVDLDAHQHNDNQRYDDDMLLDEEDGRVKIGDDHHHIPPSRTSPRRKWLMVAIGVAVLFAIIMFFVFIGTVV